METKELILTLYCCMFEGCDKSYKSKFNLKWHIEKIHLKSKKYSCPKCNQSFASNQNLKEHKYKHEGKKPYKCRLCGEQFRQYSFLYIHMREHDNEDDLI